MSLENREECFDPKIDVSKQAFSSSKMQVVLVLFLLLARKINFESGVTI